MSDLYVKAGIDIVVRFCNKKLTIVTVVAPLEFINLFVSVKIVSAVSACSARNPECA